VSEPDTLCTPGISSQFKEEGTKIITTSKHNCLSPVPDPQQSETGYYVFVTFYLAMAAKRAKEELNSRIVIKGAECKV